MSEETAAVSAAPSVATPKKKSKTAAKKAKAAPAHPKVSEMVIEAITTLKERGGSSLQAIKKHIGAHHKVDLDRLTPFIRRYLRSAVEAGALVQTKGKGANGSFKLSGTKGKDVKPAKKSKTEAAPKKAKKPATTPKKSGKPKVAAAKKKPAAAKKSSSPAKKAGRPKTPKKAAKVAKPKTPKAKKMKSPAKKAASAKKSGKK